MTRRSASITGLGLLLALATALPAPASATTAEKRYDATGVTATNHARHAHGLRKLKSNACLHRYATRQAARMAAQERMFHQDLHKPLRACHLHLVGENVAVGFPTGTSVVRQGWMHSPPHRANILDHRFRLLAVGARQGADGLWYASQLFGRR